MKGPDHESSLEEKYFKGYIDTLKKIKISINNRNRKLTKGERSTKVYNKKTIF